MQAHKSPRYYSDEEDEEEQDYYDHSASATSEYGSEEWEQTQWREGQHQLITEQFDGNGSTVTYVDAFASAPSSALRRRNALRAAASAIGFYDGHPVAECALGYMDVIYLMKKTRGQKLGVLSAACLWIACRLCQPPMHIFNFELEDAMEQAGCVRSQLVRGDEAPQRSPPPTSALKQDGSAAAAAVVKSKSKKPAKQSKRKASTMTSVDIKRIILNARRSVEAVLLEAGKISVADVETLRKSSWDTLLDRALRRVQEGAAGQGVQRQTIRPLPSLARQIGMELVRFVQLSNFQEGTHRAATVAAVLLEIRSRMLPLHTFAISDVHTFFKRGVHQNTIRTRRTKLQAAVKEWIGAEGMQATPQRFVELLRQQNDHVEHDGTDESVAGWELAERQRQFLAQQEHAAAQAAKTAKAKQVAGISAAANGQSHENDSDDSDDDDFPPRKIPRMLDRCISAESLGPDPFSPGSLDEYIVAGPTPRDTEGSAAASPRSAVSSPLTATATKALGAAFTSSEPTENAGASTTTSTPSDTDKSASAAAADDDDNGEPEIQQPPLTRSKSQQDRLAAAFGGGVIIAPADDGDMDW